MHYQLDLDIRTLMAELSLDEKALAKELGINLAHIRRLHDGSWSTITRADLQTVLAWGARHDRKDLLKIEPSPVWRTMPGQRILLFRGLDDHGSSLQSDAQVEALLVGGLKEEGCKVETRDGESLTCDQVKELMTSENCIFIGSPKHNHASENALSILYGLKPCDGSAANAAKAPFRFIWESAARRASAFGAVKRSGGSIGVELRTTGGKSGGHLLPVDYEAKARPTRSKNKGNDVGVLVLCWRPLETDKNVSTIVLAGYSGFATQDMARDLASDGVRIEGRDVQPGEPVVRVLAAKFKKNGLRYESRERVAKGRRWFGPPWTQIKNATDR